MAATPASPARSLTSPRSLTGIGSKSPNANAAADLIRNLDKALLSAQASSLTAKDDAERARRNARAAGEVARRYGGGKGAKKGPKKSTNDSGGEGSGERSLLELKRERRSRARMAAEARQRREYEMSGGGLGPSSPRWAWAASGAATASGSEARDVNKDPIVLQPRAQVGTGAAEAAGSASHEFPLYPENMDETTESNKENQKISDPVSELTAEAASNVLAHDVSNEPEDEIHHGFGVSNETMSTTDGTVSTIDFEDALDIHSVEKVNDESNGEERATPTEATDNDASYYDQQGQKSDSYAYYNQQYYDQQGQYYNQQQHQDGQHYYQTTGDQQNYYNQEGSHQYVEQTNWNTKSVSTPIHANKSVPSTTATPTVSNTLEASNAEDVLTLSLELERVRGQLATTTQHLTTSQSHISTLQSHNAHLQSELNRLHSELESVRERADSEVQSFQSKYNAELIRASAAEEDANVALELAKDATAAKEECEEWLSRSMEEINLWKGRCGELERELAAYRNQRSPEEESKKVRFADESPMSPVVSEDCGYHHQSPTGRSIPPPPPPPPSDTSNGSWSTPQTSPNKSLIASGRAFLHRASPGPSPYKAQVQNLLKRTAETRRLLQERKNTPIKQPPSMALVATSNNTSNGSLSALNEDGFASRQGAACRSVGKTIRDSGARLELDGKWFGKAETDGSAQPEPVIEGVAELESMVKEYCGSVESKIGSQHEKIEELLAFCDHLEKELTNVQ